MTPKRLPKIVVVLGPTASGKTALGLELAKKFNGEVISADSRQVYTLLDIGSGKPPGRWQGSGERAVYTVDGIPHYFMDIADPHTVLSAVDFKTQALQAIRDMARRGKLPIIVGGTGLYIQTLVDNWEIPPVAAQPKLRAELAKRPLAQMVRELQQRDQKTAAVIDVKNRRRVERALEVILTSGQPLATLRTKGRALVRALQIGLRWEDAVLRARIEARLHQQFIAGFIDETKRLRQAGYSFSDPSLSGIGYAELKSYLDGECTLPEAKKKIVNASWRYARRQMTWFKKDPRIQWIRGDDEAEALRLATDYLRG